MTGLGTRCRSRPESTKYVPSVAITGPAVRIAVEGKGQLAAEGVLKALQDSTDFADAEILSEELGMKQNGEAGVGMVLFARYVGRTGRT